MPEAFEFTRALLSCPIRHMEWAQKFNRRAAADKNCCIWHYVILDSSMENPACGDCLVVVV
jgi:hypothetical protein